MTKVKVADWVFALRSGYYQQTTDVFYNDGKYCVNGVLLHLALGLGEKSSTYVKDLYRVYNSFIFPQEWLTTYPNLSAADAKKYGRFYPNFLAELNNNGMSFDTLADIIEVNVKDRPSPFARVVEWLTRRSAKPYFVGSNPTSSSTALTKGK